jgi:hypothetical protein
MMFYGADRQCPVSVAPMRAMRGGFVFLCVKKFSSFDTCMYAPKQVPSEIHALFKDEKASADSTCDEVFWILVRALKAFVDKYGFLPLSGSLPDMHSDTKSYVELQTLYRYAVPQSWCVS